ncbi:MAG: TonB-dependent receptor, partial [Flavobacteriaceae bacterium]|nr:TonB-dependent receptor [Flavobacteriaceae bacterium]
MKTFRHLVLFASLLFAAYGAYAQGSTNSAITGKVTTSDGEPLVGVNVLAVHTPTGSRYGAVTDLEGFYRISNMRSGGPYSITVSYVGYREFKLEGETLPLGVTTRINAELQEEASALDEVVITATTDRTFDSNKTGAETYISQRDINRLPQTSRSIADFVRTTPQVQLREGDDGFSISIAGQNNRYNAIYIDGAVNNDVFGLAGSGTNGGQTGVSPFSVDAIESFQVQLAPYDVKIGGFSGGAISAVTRSGTNQWQGSSYYFYRNEDLAGKTPSGLVNEGDRRERLAEFTAETYGIRIGGPIIENKLFFFANYEREEIETPQPFNFSNYQGDASRVDIDNLIGFVRNNFGYEMGGFENNTRTLESDKFTLKLDWNLNDRHKISLSGRYVEADNLEARNSSNSFLGFANGSEAFVSETTSLSAEWGYQGDTYSNNMVVGYTRVRDDRDPAGNPFPTVVIRDGGGNMEFGAERFSTANLLDQDIFTFTNNFEIYKGAHTITFGTHNEYSDIKNLFLASNFGTYTFSSIND